MNQSTFSTTVRLVEIGAIGVRVPMAELGALDGPPISFAVAEDIPPLALRAPVYLSDPSFAGVFPEGAVQRHGKVACSIRNGFMFSPFGAIVLPDGSVVRESMLHTDAAALSFTYAQFKGQFPGHHVMWATAEGTVLSLNTYSTNNYFHFLIDAVGQLHWRDRLSAVADMRMVISGYHPEAAKALPYISAVLTRVGVSDAMQVSFDGTLMLCRHVVFPARDTGANPAKVRELRRRVGLSDKGRGSRRLYITRPGAGRRRLVNDAAIAARLAKRGFECIDPGTLPFAQQIDLFAEAQVIVGPHGAALTNAIFMPRGGALVELTHSGRVVWTFHEVACAAQLAYACVVGTRANEGEAPLFADFRVEEDAVDAAVDAVLKAVDHV